MRESAKKILETADRIYNRKNRGLEIVFEGNSDEFAALQNAIKNDFQNRDICAADNSTKKPSENPDQNTAGGMTQIAFIIKQNDILIKELTKFSHIDNSLSTKAYTVYVDNKRHCLWYIIEIDPEDFGDSYWALDKIRDITKKRNLSSVIYCRFSDLEALKNFASEFPEIKMISCNEYLKGDNDVNIDCRGLRIQKQISQS